MSKDNSLIDCFPFSSHLKSNYIPFDDEAVQIKAFLAEPRKQLEEMKIEMDRLQTELDSLKPKYDNLHHQVTSCAALITVARRLPYDVLEEIFYQALPKDRNALLSNSSVPLIFTRICRQWRQVAFSTPRLWSTIHVNLIPEPRYNPWIAPISTSAHPQRWDELRAIAASEWLKRSDNLPLHISFVANPKQPISPENVDLYLKSMVPFSSRWKSLVLEGPSTSFSRISTLEPADLRSLELSILDFDATRFHTSDESISAWSTCGLLASPSLRKLSIPPIMLADLRVDWSQLTHLEFAGGFGTRRAAPTMDIDIVSNILRVSARLIYCRVNIFSWGEPPLGHWGPQFPAPHIRLMRLPLLRTLSIIMEGNILPFTEKLEVPALQQIGLHIVENNRRRNSNTVDYNTCLAPLLQSGQGIIQKLVIDTQYLHHLSFLEILRKCPELKSLSLTRASDLLTSTRGDIPSIRIDDEFLEQISTNNPHVLCSQLEEFTCDYLAEFSAAGMIEFIKRKQNGSVPRLAKLTKVGMLLPYDKKGSLEKSLSFDELQPYISQGLTFHIFQSIKYGDFSSFNDGVDYGNSTAHYAESWA